MKFAYTTYISLQYYKLQALTITCIMAQCKSLSSSKCRTKGRMFLKFRLPQPSVLWWFTVTLQVFLVFLVLVNRCRGVRNTRQMCHMFSHLYFSTFQWLPKLIKMQFVMCFYFVKDFALVFPLSHQAKRDW